jgi:hypothetical protein
MVEHVHGSGITVSYTYIHENLGHYTCAASILCQVSAMAVTDPKKFGECSQLLFDQLKDKTQMIFVVAPVNYRQVTRGYGAHYYATADFMDWLIENKKGVVIESPITANLRHDLAMPSIVQGWIWITPAVADKMCVLPESGGIHNVESVKSLADNEKLREDVRTFDTLINPDWADRARFTRAKANWNKDRPTFVATKVERKIARRRELFGE